MTLGKGADTEGMPSARPSRRVRTALLSALAVTAAVTLSGCDALDSFTGDQEMRWVGDEVLPKDSVIVDDYRMVAALPDLNPEQAADAFGVDTATMTTPSAGVATGDGWEVTVRQTPYTTSVTLAAGCGPLLTASEDDSEAAVDAGRAALENLGGNPDTWSWFVLSDKGRSRVIAEPMIEDRQTWSTGTFAVLVDEDGVCAAKGSLPEFEKTGSTTRLASAYDTFQDARHIEGLSEEGDYREFEQSWTLEAEGRLVPLWHFDTGTKGIVAVDLGDGLETALDTETSLRKLIAQGGPAS